MTQLFKDMRAYGYGEEYRHKGEISKLNSSLVVVLVLAATVLGIAAYLASIFLPDIQRNYRIFLSYICAALNTIPCHR